MVVTSSKKECLDIVKGVLGKVEHVVGEGTEEMEIKLN